MSLDIKNLLEKNIGKTTILGICPMTKEIIEGAIREAKEENFTPMFIATPRQVDGDRGYTGWSQSDLIDFIQNIAKNNGYEGNFIIARDHGGPYQSVRDRGDSSVKLEEAMSYAKEVFREDIRAGFDIIHVDATEDPRIDGILDLEEVADRTVELISSIEKTRKKENLSKVGFEVGTEEVSGGMTEAGDFKRFVQILKEKLEMENLEGVMERLLFIVGQVGTTMRIDMKNKFDPEQAKKLTNIASNHGLFLKVHYTDWLDADTLENFPKIGIGAANVGPEFAASIVEGLEILEGKEKKALEEANESQFGSDFMEILERSAVEKAPWQKFAPEDITGGELEEFVQENKEDIALCVGRYVLNEPEVKEARENLYKNLGKHEPSINPQDFIINHVKKTIHRYVDAFNL